MFFQALFFLLFSSVYHLSPVSLRLSHCLSDLLMLCSVWQLGVGCQNSMTTCLLCSVLRSGLHKSADLVEEEKTEALKAPKDKCAHAARTLMHNCLNTHIVLVQKHILNGKSHLRTDHQSRTQTLRFTSYCQRLPE